MIVVLVVGDAVVVLVAGADVAARWSGAVVDVVVVVSAGGEVDEVIESPPHAMIATPATTGHSRRPSPQVRRRDGEGAIPTFYTLTSAASRRRQSLGKGVGTFVVGARLV